MAEANKTKTEPSMMEVRTEQEEDKQEPLASFAPPSLPTPSGKMVKHYPMEFFSARVITRAQWSSIGVHGQEGVEWNEYNNFQIPVEMFTDAALNYLLKQDGGFELVGR